MRFYHLTLDLARVRHLYCFITLIYIKPAIQITMLTENQVVVVDPGKSLRLDCIFRAEDYNIFRCPVLWEKSQRGAAMAINIMGNIHEPFMSTHRYRVELVEVPPRYSLQLYLSDVTIQDSGNYTCEVRGPHSVVLGSVFHTLYVKDPVQRVFLISEQNNSALNQRDIIPTTINLVENEATFIKCVAVGGCPPPSVDVFIGKVPYREEFYYNSSIQSTGVKGLQMMTITKEIWTSTYLPSATEDGKLLQCVVRIPGSEPYIESIKLNIDYGPKITCDRQQALVGATNVCLVCSIAAKPGDIKYLWILDANDTAIGRGDVHDSYRTNGEVVDAFTMQVSLCIRRVRPESFRVYKLVAENSVSLSTKEIVLDQRARRTTTPVTLSGMVPGKSSPKRQQTRPYEAFSNAVAYCKAQHVLAVCIFIVLHKLWMTLWH